MLMRLAYVDMLRGFACLFMIFCQMADMFSLAFNLYAMTWLQFFNWFPIFMVIAGFSCKLMFDKYDVERFYLKVLKRFLLFASIGLLLIWWCQMRVTSVLIFDTEVVGAIGLNLLFLSFWFLFTTKFKNNKLLNLIWFSFWCSMMILCTRTLNLGFFNPFFLLSFMMFGVSLAFLGEDKRLWLVIAVVFVVFGLSDFFHISYAKQNVQFWLFNSGLITWSLLIALALQRIDVVRDFLGYFGKHSLFFYFFHYFIIQKLLLVTGFDKTFSFVGGVLLSLVSIVFLVFLEKMVRPYVERFWLILKNSVLIYVKHLCA